MKFDLLPAWRSLRRRPAFTALAVVPLAIGIGFTTAIFSIANALLIRPLPFADADRLMMLQSTEIEDGRVQEFSVSAPDLDDWERESRSFSTIGAAMGYAFNLTGRSSAPQRVAGARVTAGLFRTLGVVPVRGRVITPEEEHGDAPVAVVSSELGNSRFGSAAAAVGRTLLLDGRPFSVVGVLPPGFRFGLKADVWVPFARRGTESSRRVKGLNVVGRLRPGISPERAASEMKGIASALATAFPETNRGWGVSVRPLRDVLVEDVRSAVWILLAAAGFLLLVACVNVSNLLLVRAIDRRGETAVRAALGAGRGVLIRGFLAESAILSALGGASGVLLAWAGLRPLLAVCPVELSKVGSVGIDLRVLLFAIAVSAACALLFGTAAGWEGSRYRIAAVLNDAGRAASGGRGSRRIQGILVSLQVAVVVLLVTGSAVALLTFVRLARVSPGFVPEGALTVGFALPQSRYPELSQRAAVVRRVAAEVSRIPGVTAVGVTNKLPLDDRYMLTQFIVEGGRRPSDQEGWPAHFRRVTPGYFRAMRIPILAGREFTDDDVEGKPIVAVVSRELARNQWGETSPLGRRLLRTGAKQDWITVVGVAGDVRDVGLAKPAPPTLYICYYQGKTPLPDLNVVARTALPPSAVARPLRERLASVDPELPAGSIEPLSCIISESLKRQRFQMILMGLLSGAGTILAAVGVFGLTAYSVSRQQKELSIRLALGATTRGIVGLIVRRAARLAGLGIAAGVVGVVICRGVLAGMLPGAPSPGAAIVAPIGAILGVVCLLSSWVAARRAARISPSVALASAGAR